MDKTIISIVKCNSYMQESVDKNIGQLIEGLGRRDLYINPGDTVLIKANIGMANTPEKAATTHPAVVRSLVKEIKKRGGRAIIGDDPIIPRIAEETMEISGMNRVAREEQVDISVFANDEGFIDVKLPSYNILSRLNYSKRVLDVDLIISVPKLKTHILTGLSCSIKNMMGCVERVERKRIHELHSGHEFSQALLDIYSIRPPDITVVDAITSMVGLGPSHGTAADTGFLMASTNGYAVDAVASNILGYGPGDVGTVEISKKEGKFNEKDFNFPLLGPWELPGTKWPLSPQISDDVRKRFRNFLLMSLSVDRKICSGCGACIQHCPAHAMSGAPPEIDYKLCLICFCCFELCPNGAVKFKIPSVTGKHEMISKNQVVERLNRGEGF